MDGTSFFLPLAARARVGGRSVATTLGREPQRCRGGQRFFMEMANVLSRCPVVWPCFYPCPVLWPVCGFWELPLIFSSNIFHKIVIADFYCL